jgi:threonine/homoserine/homoserine lactone efflux protein
VIGIVAIGLTSLMATMGYWFDWVRFAGAAYLVWLGIKLIRAPAAGVDVDAPSPPPRGGFFLQGFLVLLSNPKVLVFFGAFIPQFMDMSKDHFSQVALLGSTFMVTGAITDTIFALLAGRARKFFSARRTRLLSRISGGFMLGGGVLAGPDARAVRARVASLQKIQRQTQVGSLPPCGEGRGEG